MSSQVSQYIKSHPVFSTEALLASCGDTQTNRNLLHRAKRAGRVRSVRRGLYASNDGRYEGTSPAAQLVASMVADDAVLCHSTAFSLFLGTHDILTAAQLYTATKARPFEFDGVRYIPINAPVDSVETQRYYLAGGVPVTGTTKEQTVVDSIASPGRGGGVESVLRELSAIRYLDVERAVRLCAGRGPSACARLGWVLERRRGEWGVADDVLNEVAKYVGGGPYYFGPPSARLGHNERWHLYLPDTSENLERWLNG